jgi:hypothetical protein
VTDTPNAENGPLVAVDDPAVLRRIITALPDCLTPTAVQEVLLHLAAEMDDDQAATTYHALVYDAEWAEAEDRAGSQEGQP